MPQPLLSLNGISIRYGSTELFNGLDLQIHAQDRLCLVGRNGAGKSTLLKIAAGLIEPDTGDRTVASGAHVAYLSQTPDLSAYDAIGAFVREGLPDTERDEHHRVEAALAAYGLSPETAPSTLSGGEARRAALARAFISDPDLLILDEPTNHLDLPAIQNLEAQLRQYRGAYVVISHDRAFLANTARACLWLDRGVVRRLDKGFDQFEMWTEEVLTQEEAEAKRLDKRIAEETVWLHKGVTARRKRNQGRLRRLHALRAERAERRTAPGAAKLELESGEASGSMVIEAKDISKAYGSDTRPLVQEFSTRIMRGDRIGIVGPNGAGKTTLLNMLTGRLAPDTGTVRHGTNLNPVYLDQTRDRLDQNQRVLDVLCPGGGDQVIAQGKPKHVYGFLQDFLFDPAQARQPVHSLSGGEQNRLCLAAALSKPANLLVLDEPTNDLDMDTLDLLQEQLADYDGVVLLVSHDRSFLDNVVSSVIVFEGDGRLVEHAGGYSDYAQRQDKPAPAQAAKANKPSTDKPKPKSVTKLSYKDARALEALEKRMPELEAEKTRLEASLADPDLFAKNPDAFASATKALQAAIDELAAAEEQWLELEALKEELSGA